MAELCKRHLILEELLRSTTSSVPDPRLADANALSLQGKPFHIINRVLDHAIGLACRPMHHVLWRCSAREEYLAFVHTTSNPLTAILGWKSSEMTLPGQR